MFVNVILPIAFPKPLTYQVPNELVGDIVFGIRVEVPLKNHVVSGVVVEMNVKKELGTKIKNVISILDENPTITPTQYQFWKWIAEYYCCTIGEVMGVALPGGLKLVSETKILLLDNFDPYSNELNDEEFMIAEALHLQGELKISDIQDIIQKKSVYPIIQSLFEKQAILLKEELIEKYKPKKEYFIQFTEEYRGDEEKMVSLFDLVERSELQKRVLLAYIQMSQGKHKVLQSRVTKKAETSSSVVKAMVKKGIFIQTKESVSRIKKFDIESDATPLSSLQAEKLEEIKLSFEQHSATLLHGVTGSGKTRIYIELIQELLNRGEQILYLLPEIALTTHIVERLKVIFGDKLIIYHSRLNSQERVELYRKAFTGANLIIGPRSAIFLPFKKLKLIIVDEEHDGSYKQRNPAPRYNARDLSLVLARLYNAKVLLGTATPSLESWMNAQENKYGLVTIEERYGPSIMPHINIIDLRYNYQSGTMRSYFALDLLRALEECLAAGEQAILFQNRRGYAPVVECNLCGWSADCRNCDTTLTLHKYFEELRCHYCGYHQKIPQVCPECGNTELDQSGFGTEKIQVELEKLLPEAKIGRLDYDTAKSKKGFERIFDDFTNGRIDILVGTQMITKGLDFGNVSVVGILNADKMMYYPDFRSHERAFQLMLQVSGRAGRRRKQGNVYIQTYSPELEIFKFIRGNKYSEFMENELRERKNHLFPPYVRMIRIEIKHKKVDIVKDGSILLANLLKAKLGKRVTGAFEPSISRLRNYYIRHIIIKMENDLDSIKSIKSWIIFYKNELRNSDGYKSLRINIDVDPY